MFLHRVMDLATSSYKFHKGGKWIIVSSRCVAREWFSFFSGCAPLLFWWGPLKEKEEEEEEVFMGRRKQATHSQLSLSSWLLAWVLRVSWSWSSFGQLGAGETSRGKAEMLERRGGHRHTSLTQILSRFWLKANYVGPQLRHNTAQECSPPTFSFSWLNSLLPVSVSVTSCFASINQWKHTDKTPGCTLRVKSPCCACICSPICHCESLRHCQWSALTDVYFFKRTLACM